MHDMHNNFKWPELPAWASTSAQWGPIRIYAMEFLRLNAPPPAGPNDSQIVRDGKGRECLNIRHQGFVVRSVPVTDVVRLLDTQPVRHPFDLERAKAGAAVVGRDGMRARFVAHVPDATESSRVVILLGQGEEVTTYYENGRRDPANDSPIDLFMRDAATPGKRVAYALWLQKPINDRGLIGALFDTEENAREGGRARGWEGARIDVMEIGE